MAWWQRVSTDLKQGARVVRKDVTRLTTVVLRETELLRLKLRLNSLDQRLAEAYIEIGEQAYLECTSHVGANAASEPVERARLCGEARQLLTERQHVVEEMEDCRRGPR